MLIVHNLLTIVSTDIETDLIQSVALYRLVMFTVHNLFTVVYICSGNCPDTASETEWTRKYVRCCLYSRRNCSDTASETVVQPMRLYGLLNMFTIVYIDTETVLTQPVTLYGLVYMFAVHNLFTVVYILLWKLS